MELTQKQIDELMEKAKNEGRNEILKDGTPSIDISTTIKSDLPGEELFKAYVASTLYAKKEFGRTEPTQIAVAAERLIGTKMSKNYKSGTFETINKGLTENSLSGGGYLDFPEFSPQFLESLYPPYTLRNMPGIQTWTISGKNLIVSRSTAVSSGGWGDELFNVAQVPVANPQFGQLKLEPKDMYASATASFDMLEDSSLDVVGIISKDLVKESYIIENTGYWNGTGSVYQPLGIVNQLVQFQPQNTFGNTQAVVPSYVTANSNTATYNTFSAGVNNYLAGSAAKIWPEQDLKNAIVKVRTGYNELNYQNFINDPLVWVMNTDTYYQLATLRSPVYGQPIFPTIFLNNTLMGFPIQISSDSDNPNFRIYCVAPSKIIIGDRLGLSLTTDPIQNVIAQAPNQHVIFLRKRTDIKMQYSTAMSFIDYRGQ